LLHNNAAFSKGIKVLMSSRLISKRAYLAAWNITVASYTAQKTGRDTQVETVNSLNILLVSKPKRVFCQG